MRLPIVITLAFAILLPVRLWAAAGDIVGASIDPDGWSASIYVSGAATNGTYTFGFGPNNRVTLNQTVVFNIDRPGYDGTGTAISKRKTVLGTQRIRKPYPDQASAWETVDSGVIRLRISLSEHVYAEDGNVRAWLRPDFYVSGGTHSAGLSDFAVTNSSSATFDRCVANWSRRGFRVVDEPVMRLRAIGFAKQAEGGQPLACMRFLVSDGTTVWTNNQNRMRIDWNYGDAMPVQEYIADFPTNLFGSSKALTCSIIGFPQEGDTNAVVDTRLLGYVEPTPYPANITNYVNLPRVRAIYDPVSGSDTTGVAADEAVWAGNTNIARFATIGGAWRAIAGTNGASYGRTNGTGGIIYLTTFANYLGLSISLNACDAELVITRHPMVSRDACGVTNYATDRVATTGGDVVTFRDTTLDTSATLLWTVDMRKLRFERCNVLNAMGSKVFGAGTVYEMDGCTVSNMYGGFVASGTDTMCWGLVRGNRLVGSVPTFIVYTAIGNSKRTTNLCSVANSFGGMSMPRSFPTILAYNEFLGQNVSWLNFGSHYPCVWGEALVQNVFEFAGTSPAVYGAGTWESDNVDATNSIYCYMLTKGAKNNMDYDNLGTNGPTWRVRAERFGNIWSTRPIKTDTHTADVPSGVRTGNWAQVWAVNNQGNAELGTVGLVSFENAEYTGVGCFQGNTTPTNYARWLREGGQNGTTNLPPFGDYALASSSPLHTNTIRYRWFLPYDIEGRPRSLCDPPGPYARSNPKRTTAFMSQ